MTRQDQHCLVLMNISHDSLRNNSIVLIQGVAIVVVSHFLLELPGVHTCHDIRYL